MVYGRPVSAPVHRSHRPRERLVLTHHGRLGAHTQRGRAVHCGRRECGTTYSERGVMHVYERVEVERSRVRVRSDAV